MKKKKLYILKLINYIFFRLIDDVFLVYSTLNERLSRIAQLVEQSIYGRVTGLNPVATYQN